jgi:hypothetical protein
MKQYQSAIGYYEQLLELLQALHQDIAKNFSSIAMAYEFWKKYSKAIDYIINVRLKSTAVR